MIFIVQHIQHFTLKIDLVGSITQKKRWTKNAVNGLKSCSLVPSQHWLSQNGERHQCPKLPQKDVRNAWKFGKPYISPKHNKEFKNFALKLLCFDKGKIY